MKAGENKTEAGSLSRLGFIRMSGAFAAFGASAAAERPVVKVGFLTDTHVTPDRKSAALTRRAFALFKREGVAAIGHCGDLADYHYPEAYRHYRDAFTSVYPDPAGEPSALYVFAAHDALIPGVRPPRRMPDEKAYARMRDILKIGHGIIHETVIGGVPFVVYPQSIHHHCGGTLEAFDRHLAKVCAEHPAGPVVLMTHFPPKDTVAGSDRWGNATIGAVIRKYPRVIAFTGHVHNSLRNEACIWQGDCTVVDVGCLQVWHGRSAGTKVRSKPAYEVLVAEFGPDRVVVRRYDVRDGREIRPDRPWTVPLPYDRATAPYAPSRRAKTERPGRFPPDARIRVSADGDTVEVTFPPALNEEDVLWYRITVNGRVADQFSAFYIRPEDRAASRVRTYADGEFGAPDTSGAFRVEVRPVGFFGTEGRLLKTYWKKG